MSFAGLRFIFRVACPSFSLSSVTVVTLACRALRRVDFCIANTGSMSRLALRMPLRVARSGRGVFTLDGGCEVGVFRRLPERTPLRSAMMSSIDALWI
jgi:hypothetical protein